MSVVATVLAAVGTFYLYTALGLRWPGLGPTPRLLPRRRAATRSLRAALDQAGLAEVPTRRIVAAVGGLAAIGCLAGFALFGGLLPALLCGGCATVVPVGSFRRRRRHRRDLARETWPRLIDEIRVLTGSVGRSIPQALFEAGRHGPPELREVFVAAERTWRITTDLGRALEVLKQQIGDPGVDATCETLLIAYELGGTDLERRLVALAEDRRLDASDRKDARARQAGARFARRFVLLVPLGMALAGMSVGNGRDAYQTPSGQATVAVALLLVIACWVWAGRVMRLPDEQRVFV